MNFLGQHFLKNKSALKKIVAALAIAPDEIIVEIGPGHGELTEIIKHETHNMKPEVKIIAIEKDGRLTEQLRKKLKDVEVIEGDALKVLPQLCSKLHAPRFKMYGNIPYYITGHLLRIIGELEKKPQLAVFTVQKEVAERIAAVAPRMNRLAASVRFWAEPKIIMTIAKKDFDPPPKIDSAVLKLATKDRTPETSTEKYYKAVKILFQQPRKTILNNLAAAGKKDRDFFLNNLEKIGISPEWRPQNLDVEDIVKIARFLGV